MEEKEDKGFVFKDRRKIDRDADRDVSGGTSEQEDVRESQAGKIEEQQARQEFEKASEENINKGHAAFPEVTLSTFVFSLSSSALVHLGEIPEPDTQTVRLDLPMAKQIIDTIGMLQEKTRGNLDPDEDRLLKSVLYDLRMRYVEKSGR